MIHMIHMIDANPIDLPTLKSISLDMYSFQGDASYIRKMHSNYSMNTTVNMNTSQLIMSSMYYNIYFLNIRHIIDRSSFSLNFEWKWL